MWFIIFALRGGQQAAEHLVLKEQNGYLEYPLCYRWASGDASEMLYTFTIKHTGSSHLHGLWMPSEGQLATLKWDSEQKVPLINIRLKTCPHMRPRLQKCFPFKAFVL